MNFLDCMKSESAVPHMHKCSQSHSYSVFCLFPTEDNGSKTAHKHTENGKCWIEQKSPVSGLVKDPEVVRIKIPALLDTPSRCVLSTQPVYLIIHAVYSITDAESVLM